MKPVTIITDSTACIPAALAATFDIRVLPLFLEFEDSIFEDGMGHEDGVGGSAASFYQALREAKQPPTTAAPAPGVYAEAMLDAGRNATAVLAITVSRQFSAMYDAASQGMALAKQQAPDLDVRVLDSESAAMAQGFVALEAARAAQEGIAIDNVIKRAEALRPRVQLLVALDTMTYLGRSGRVPRLLAWVASPLLVKPVVAFEKGSYRPIGLARSTAGASDRLFQALKQRRDGTHLHVAVQHTNAPDEAALLAGRVRDELRPTELFVTEFTQVMGVHTGPGLLGFAFYSEQS
jgi:DegV family protein with EDD domain